MAQSSNANNEPTTTTSSPLHVWPTNASHGGGGIVLCHTTQPLPVTLVNSRYGDGATVSFATKSGAMAWYMQNPNAQCALFANEKPGGNGSQTFFASPYERLFQLLKETRIERRSMHEFVMPLVPTKVFFDVDVNHRVINDPHFAFIPSCVRIVQYWIQFLKYMFRPPDSDRRARSVQMRKRLDEMDPVRSATYLMGSKPGKHSMHIVMDDTFVARTQKDLASMMRIFMLYARGLEVAQLREFNRLRAEFPGWSAENINSRMELPIFQPSNPSKRISLFQLSPAASSASGITGHSTVCTNPPIRLISDHSAIDKANQKPKIHPWSRSAKVAPPRKMFQSRKLDTSPRNILNSLKREMVRMDSNGRIRVSELEYGGTDKSIVAPQVMALGDIVDDEIYRRHFTSLRMYRCVKNKDLQTRPIPVLYELMIKDSLGEKCEIRTEFSLDVCKKSLLQYFEPASSNSVNNGGRYVIVDTGTNQANMDLLEQQLQLATQNEEVRPSPIAVSVQDVNCYTIGESANMLESITKGIRDWYALDERSKTYISTYTKHMVQMFGRNQYGLRLPPSVLSTGLDTDEIIDILYNNEPESVRQQRIRDGVNGKHVTRSANGSVVAAMNSQYGGNGKGDSGPPNVTINGRTRIPQIFTHYFLETTYRSHTEKIFKTPITGMCPGSVSTNNVKDVLCIAVRNIRCEIVYAREKRLHTSSTGNVDSGQYFIVNLRTGYAYQKCFKSSCKNSPVRSPRIPLDSGLVQMLQAELDALDGNATAPIRSDIDNGTSTITPSIPKRPKRHVAVNRAIAAMMRKSAEISSSPPPQATEPVKRVKRRRIERGRDMSEESSHPPPPPTIE